MCLARAFVDSWSDGPVLQDIAHMKVHEDKIELETLFGKGKTIPGKIIEIDFTASRILLKQHHMANDKV